MMIGLEVAPVAPQARLWATSSGSMESNHSFVPEAISDWSGMLMIFLRRKFVSLATGDFLKKGTGTGQVCCVTWGLFQLGRSQSPF